PPRAVNRARRGARWPTRRRGCLKYLTFLLRDIMIGPRRWVSPETGSPPPAPPRRRFYWGKSVGLSGELRAGMSMDDVRMLLRGWRESLPGAVLSPDKTHLF